MLGSLPNSKMIRRPSTRTFLKIVDNNLLPNCPINGNDSTAVEKTFGPDMGSIEGKTVRHAATLMEAHLVNISAEIMSRCCDVIRPRDIMFVNKIPFLMKVSRYIKFGTAEMIKNQQGNTTSANRNHHISMMHHRIMII